MTFPDVKTIFVVYVVFSVLGVVVMTSLWLQNRKRSPEIALWLADYVLQLVAILLITLRGIVPDLISIVFANTLIVGGTVILYIGIERYVEEKSPQLHNYIMVSVFTLVHVYCPLRGEKPSTLVEDFSKLAVWKITENQVIPSMI